MEIIKGDLIKLALEGKFDVIAHGCNCFSVQNAGIAKQMNEVFNTNLGDYRWYPSEIIDYYSPRSFYAKSNDKVGDVFKLGNIEYVRFFGIEEDGSTYFYNYAVSDLNIENGIWYFKNNKVTIEELTVVNMYTQYYYGKHKPLRGHQHLDYQALEMCLVKLNKTFADKHIGLPKIGCGLAGGDWFTVKFMIKRIMKDCKVTIVEYEK